MLLVAGRRKQVRTPNCRTVAYLRCPHAPTLDQLHPAALTVADGCVSNIGIAAEVVTRVHEVRESCVRHAVGQFPRWENRSQ